MEKVSYDIRKATDDDFDAVKYLWKKYKRQIGIPYTKSIYTFIRSRNAHVLEISGTVVGMVGYAYDKKELSATIVCLAIDDKWQRMGFGTILLNYIIKLIPNRLFGKTDIYANVLDGDVNNKFYDNFGTVVRYIDYKTCKTRIYLLDKVVT